MIDRAAAAAGITLHPQAEIDGVRLLASLAFEGFGAGDRPRDRRRRWLRGDFHRIAVPELPRRVVGWAQRRRPDPGSGDEAPRSTCLRDLVAARGPEHGRRARRVADLLTRPRT